MILGLGKRTMCFHGFEMTKVRLFKDLKKKNVQIAYKNITREDTEISDHFEAGFLL